MVGKSLRYVAEHQGRWLALLDWQSATPKCKPRDQWIGWSSFLQYQRLSLIANNTRFLILPDITIKNLASRLLSLNLKRSLYQQLNPLPDCRKPRGIRHRYRTILTIALAAKE